MENSVDSNSQDVIIKKRPLDDLNREELLLKCKGLLALAQKAKQAKSELQSEVEELSMRVKTCELEKNVKDENIQTLQELVDSLTEQKLTFITEIDTAQSKLKTLNTEFSNYKEEIKKRNEEQAEKDKNFITMSQKLSDLDNQIISLKRQNNRLSEENDQLINQLTELESRAEEFNKIGLQQREQLRILEEQGQSDDKRKIEELKKKIKRLESIQDDKMIISNEEYNNLKILYEQEKSKNEKANNKLRVYKDKIMKCANCINQLKNSRFVLNKTVKEYSENIPKWQNEILKASKILDEKINELHKENEMLKGKIKDLETHTTDSCDIAKQIIDLQQQLQRSNDCNNELSKEITLLTSNCTELEKTIEDKIKENETLKEQVNNLSKQVINESTVNKELTDKIHNLIDKNKEMNVLINSKLQNRDTEDKLKFQIKSLETEKAILVKEKLTAKDNIIDLESQNKLLNEQVLLLTTNCKDFQDKIDVIQNDSKILQNEHKKEKDDLCSKLTILQEEHEKLKKDYDNLQDLNGLLQEEVETLKLSLEQPKDDAENSSDINVSLQADIVKLETKLSAYKQENALLLTEVKETRTKIKEFDKLVVENEEAKSKLLSYKTENTELLSEMKEINQVLKERGEAISKLQKAISEMEKLIETLEKDRDAAKEEKIILVKSVDILKADLSNAQKNKTESTDVSEKLVIERDNAIKSLKENEATIAALHEEIDKLKQQSAAGAELPNEDMSTSTISRAEEHARMKDLDETFEEKYSKLRLFALKLKKKLNETTSQLQASEKENLNLKTLVGENADTAESNENQCAVIDGSNACKSVDDLCATELTLKVKNLHTKIEKLENDNKNLEADLQKSNEKLQKEIDLHKTTQDQLDKAMRDVKKKNVLSLEMEDYERSMKELTTKMQDNKKKIIQMESTIDTQETTITAMKTQIKLLEEQIKSEEAQNRRTKEELYHAIEESKEKDNVVNVKNNIISKLTQELEDEKRKKEEAELEMTGMLSEREKVLINHAEEKIELNNKMKRLEFKCAELNDKLLMTNTELADLKTEYTSYKVRAQAVLRQNQTVDHSQEEQLKEEAAALRTQIDALTQKLTTLQEQLAEACADAEASRKRAAEATAEAARAHTRTTRLQADLARLSHQLDSDRTQHKLQVSTLTQCYKSQINELEAKLQKETESLKKQLVLFQENAKNMKDEDSNREKYMLPVIPKEEGSDGEMDINVSLIPREEGEGSEAAPSPPLSKSFMSGGNRRSPVPLERLLEEGVSEDDALDRSSLALTADQEIAELKRKVQGQQQKVKHVTVLLAESERECARLTQLSDLLKGELRRVRGAAHGYHNTEYMKNVTLKFLTLPPGDERSRLIPVLQKILTLSNEETQKIQAIAKGQDPNSSKGWGSYLPWPGGK